MEVKLLPTGEIQVIVPVKSHEYNTFKDLKEWIFSELRTMGVLGDEGSFYLLRNGKKVDDNLTVGGNDETEIALALVPTVLGGKGGFGSMLRAIGAQIEKTTNRDACRDLSGRRLRDINEEQRLKKWFARQAEREKEKQEAKKRKLEKLKQVADGPALPKIDDQEFLQKREDIEESVYEAVDEGFTHESQVKAELSSGDSNSSDSVPSSSGTQKVEEECGCGLNVASSSDASKSVDTSVPGSSKGPEVKKTVRKTMFDDLDSGSESDSDDDGVPTKVAKIN